MTLHNNRLLSQTSLLRFQQEIQSRLEARNIRVNPEEEALRTAARQSLLKFTEYTYSAFKANWHHQLIASALDRVAAGTLKRLMIFSPPRHGKSELLSRRFPAYILGRNPDARIIAAAYNTDFASDFNRDVQRIIDSDVYHALFPDTQLWGANVRTSARGTYLRNSDIFQVVNHSGFYRSAGWGGAMTGIGMDFGIVDDLIKNRAEANSPTYRRNVWDWYRSTFYTRLEKDAAIVISLTRWHRDDLVGRVLDLAMSEEGADQWDVISLPAIAEGKLHPDDPRQPGEALWVNKYDAARLAKTKSTVGNVEWSSLYQQEPLPDGGGLFDPLLLQIVDAPPECVSIVRHWDLAVSSKTTADYTVGLKMGVDAAHNPIVLDVFRRQYNPVDTGEAIVQCALIDGKQVPIYLEAENSARVQLDYLLRDPRLHNHTLYLRSPEGDKVTRALPIATRVNSGKATLKRAAWNRAFIDELAVFPQGRNDDQVDAFSGAWKAIGVDEGPSWSSEVV